MNRFTMIMILCIAAVVPARADTILLKNGAVFEGEIFKENEKEVGLKIAFGGGEDKKAFIEKFFPRSRIKNIRRGGRRLVNRAKPLDLTAKNEDSAPAEDINKPKDGEKDEELFPEEVKDKERKKLFGEDNDDDSQGPEQPKLDPALSDQIKDLIKDLGNSREAVQKQARERLTSLGKDATPLLIKTLAEAIQKQRIMLIMTIGDIGDKRATQVMIGELKGPSTQSERTSAAHEALGRITGKTFPFLAKGNSTTRNAQIQKWRDWFDVAKGMNTYKIQINTAGKLINAAATQDKK